MAAKVIRFPVERARAPKPDGRLRTGAHAALYAVSIRRYDGAPPAAFQLLWAKGWLEHVGGSLSPCALTELGRAQLERWEGLLPRIW